MPEELFECDDAAFYTSLIDGRGRVLGLFDGEALVACSVISWPGPHAPDNLGADIDLDITECGYVANLEAAYMLPSYQGRGIARVLSGTQLAHALELGKRYALSTASPAHLYSLKNLFSLGLRIRKIARKYGTKTRCILYRALAEDPKDTHSGSDREGIWVPARDLERQKELLAQGYEGVRAQGVKEKFSILYSPITASR